MPRNKHKWILNVMKLEFIFVQNATLIIQQVKNKMKKEEKIILFDSDEAVKFVENISGWVDNKGYFYGKDENLARYSSCTHKKCVCGELMKKNYTMCDKCSKKRTIEKYNNLKAVEWDGNSPIYSDTTSDYFWNEDELLDYCSYEEIKNIEDLRLLSTKPIKLRGNIDLYDLYSHDLPEDYVWPNEILETLKKLNMLIDNLPPVSVFPSNERIIYDYKPDFEG